MKKSKKIVFAVLAVLFLSVAAVGIYMAVPLSNIDEDALKDSDNVSVNVLEDGIFYDGPGDKTALIYYPGGKVDYIAYSSLMKKISEQGIDCFVMKMPLNFALLGSDKADRILRDYDYEEYYGGGHSLGGVAMSMYLFKNSDLFKGVIYTGSYTSTDLSNTNLKVLMIRGSNDGLVSEEDEEKSLALLPEDIKQVVIEGGNHAQYGTYGNQSKDNEATISGTQQITETASLIVEFINEN